MFCFGIVQNSIIYSLEKGAKFEWNNYIQRGITVYRLLDLKIDKPFVISLDMKNWQRLPTVKFKKLILSEEGRCNIWTMMIII